MSIRILELGSYVAPAFAGMILAEQGCSVEKWTVYTDPILQLHRGNELWDWINHGKTLVNRHAREVVDVMPGTFDIVIDNVRPSTLATWGVDPEEEAKRLNCTWVSLRADVGEVSFDVIAQAQAWMGIGPYVPFYIGDTAAGLWMAFKALAKRGEARHFVIPQATSLMKLVEGELCVEVDRNGATVPWDTSLYCATTGIDRPGVPGAMVEHKGSTYFEPARDRDWQWEHLRHVNGRMVI